MQSKYKIFFSKFPNLLSCLIRLFTTSWNTSFLTVSSPSFRLNTPSSPPWNGFLGGIKHSPCFFFSFLRFSVSSCGPVQYIHGIPFPSFCLHSNVVQPHRKTLLALLSKYYVIKMDVMWNTPRSMNSTISKLSSICGFIPCLFRCNTQASYMHEGSVTYPSG